MVFFTCNSCGANLKKNAVEKHSYNCNLRGGLSCMDCHKLFGEDYVDHLNCITEAQKYGGSDFVPKNMKGQNKQEHWISSINRYLQEVTDISADVKDILKHISTLPNVPRKQKPFCNFMRNNGYYKEPLQKKIWNVLSSISASQSKQNHEKLQESHEGQVLDEKPLQNVDLNCPNNENEETNRSKKKDTKDKKYNNTDFDYSKLIDSKEEIALDGGPKKKKKKRRLQNNEENGDLKKEFSSTPLTSVDVETEIDTKSLTKKKKKHKLSDLDKDDSTDKGKSDIDVVSKDLNVTAIDNEALLDFNDACDNSKNGKKKRSSMEDKLLNDSQSSEFKWKSSLKRALQDSVDGKMKIKKLKRTVVGMYLSSFNLDRDRNEGSANEIFDSKITNSPKFVIEGKYVRLKH